MCILWSFSSGECFAKLISTVSIFCTALWHRIKHQKARVVQIESLLCVRHVPDTIMPSI
jgi:hypothetical protein